MAKTSIEWTDFSINPLRARIGDGDGHYCEKISPGCKRCYSSRLQPRFRMPQFQEQRGKADIYFDAAKLEQVLKRRKPTKWFWCDMTDMFGAWVPYEWIAACFGVMAATTQHTHQVLTKREQILRSFMLNEADRLWGGPPSSRFCTFLAWARLKSVPEADEKHIQLLHDLAIDSPTPVPWPPPNVHIGVSVENREHGVPRIDVLRDTPAAVRFLSIEPLLEDLGKVDLRGIDQVIVGSESGRGARAMNEDWVRSIRDQAKEQGCAFLYKQRLDARGRKVSLPVLDGRQWAEQPEVRHG